MEGEIRDRAITSTVPIPLEKRRGVPRPHLSGLTTNISRPGSMTELRGGIKMSKKPRGPGKTLATWSSQDSLHHRWDLIFDSGLEIHFSLAVIRLFQKVKNHKRIKW